MNKSRFEKVLCESTFFVHIHFYIEVDKHIYHIERSLKIIFHFCCRIYCKFLQFYLMEYLALFDFSLQNILNKFVFNLFALTLICISIKNKSYTSLYFSFSKDYHTPLEISSKKYLVVHRTSLLKNILHVFASLCSDNAEVEWLINRSHHNGVERRSASLSWQR